MIMLGGNVVPYAEHIGRIVHISLRITTKFEKILKTIGKGHNKELYIKWLNSSMDKFGRY